MSKQAHIRARVVASELVLEFRGEVPQGLRVGHPVTVCGAFPYTWFDDTDRVLLRTVHDVREAEGAGHTVIPLFKEVD